MNYNNQIVHSNTKNSNFIIKKLQWLHLILYTLKLIITLYSKSFQITIFKSSVYYLLFCKLYQ